MKNIEMSLYDLNKQAMNEVKPLDMIISRKSCLAMAEDFFTRKKKIKYCMLLCRERYDFTVFHLIREPALYAKELVECLENRGKILSIQKLEDDNYEIWLRIGTENFVYYLFNYDDAVIEV